ncbi:MAG: 30S ribosomal protein S6e, partial [Thermoprotei archaeon]
MPEFKIVISDPKAKSDKGIGVKVIGDSELKYGVDEKEGKKIPRAKVNPRLLKILNAELGFITIRIWKSKESREKVNFTFHAIPDESLDVQVIKVPEDLLREKLGVSEIIGEVFRTRSFQVVISGDKAQQLLGLRIGDRFDGSIVGLPGKILEIRGG